MPDLTNLFPLGIEEAATSPASAAVGEAESIPNDLIDYVTPPSKKVIVVPVRYSAAKKGTPMPYDLAAADEEQ